MNIIFKDDHLLVINKPNGLLVHRSVISNDRDSVIDQFKREFEEPPTPLHRLDRPTSGVLLSSFDINTTRLLSNQFRNNEIKKKYLAVVRGWPEESGVIDSPLKKEGRDEPQEALTKWKLICKSEIDVPNDRYPKSRYSLLEVKPKTGRFHQIRRHLSRVGYPIPGDTSHGDLRHNRIVEKFTGINRLLLHAYSIEVHYPKKDFKKKFTAKLPDDFRLVLEKLFKKEIIDTILCEYFL